MNAPITTKAAEKVKVTFTTITDPSRRRLKIAVLVGIIAGFFSGIIKFGWEVPFPPRGTSLLGSTSLSSLGTSSGCGRLSWSAATCVTALPVNPMQSTR